jgi:hypothetical protein
MKVMESYFKAEKAESLLFIGVGIVAIIVALYFLFSIKQSAYTGAAISLTLIAFIQLIVGTTVYFRSDKDIARVETMLKQNPQQLKTEEQPRMAVVMKNFIVYRYVEMALMLIGLALIIFFRASSPASFWYGLGWGLLIQSGFMLLLDFFAERRGHTYLNWVQEQIQNL